MKKRRRSDQRQKKWRMEEEWKRERGKNKEKRKRMKERLKTDVWEEEIEDKNVLICLKKLAVLTV